MNLVIGISFVCLILLITVTANTITPYVKIYDEDAAPYKEMPPLNLNPKEKEKQYWQDQAANTLEAKLKRKLNTNVAKNIIFFLGDGLSVTTITAARIYQGQLKNRSGEEEKLFFETFSDTGLSKTYCLDKQVADSACTATAYMCGVKANFQTIGVTGEVEVSDCEKAKLESNRVSSILKWSQDAGKATGVVTTARVTHASPAGCYAHVPFRDMESDGDIEKYKLDQNSCNFDIAKQLIYEDPGKNINVIMGGGRGKFLPKDEKNSTYGSGSRLDKNLIEEWKNDKALRKANAVYVSNITELKQVDPTKTDYLLGLFATSHMNYNLEKKPEEPTLTEMTEMAIKILQKNPNGFYLFVEGAKIDMAHHEDAARMALDETLQFAEAIEKAYSLTKEEDTLIVVTADHAHTMTMSGYPDRGYNILGLFGKSKDNLPYSTLSYANGPGYHMEKAPGVRFNLENDHLDEHNYTYPALVPKYYESHGGDDVAVYANGPWSHLFSGNYEQNYIPIAEAYAAGISPSNSKISPRNSVARTSATTSVVFLFIFNFIFSVFFKKLNFFAI